MHSGYRKTGSKYKEGGDTMQKQTVEFAVKRDNGIITRVGRTGILQPKPNYKGNPDSVKWYEDKPKQKSK